MKHLPVSLSHSAGTATNISQDFPLLILQIECIPLQNEQTLDERLKSFWELESFGITQPDHTVLDDFQERIRFGRYQVSLLWKHPCPLLPDNYQLSVRHLRGLLRQLPMDKNILTKYDAIIKNQIQQGSVDVVKPSERATRVHYFPHHAVIRRDKETTKLRIVYDASVRANGSSLNECLHAGPKFDQKILDLLLRF